MPGFIARHHPDHGRTLNAWSGYDFDVIQRSLPYLFQEGMTFTLTLTLLAMAGGIIFGTMLAMMRLSSFKVAVIRRRGSYVNLMRSVPLVLVIFWFYFLVPYIGAWIIGAASRSQVGAFFSSRDHVHAVRSGVLLRNHARRHPVDTARTGPAGHALGMNYWQTMGQSCCRRRFAT